MRPSGCAVADQVAPAVSLVPGVSVPSIAHSHPETIARWAHRQDSDDDSDGGTEDNSDGGEDTAVVPATAHDPAHRHHWNQDQDQEECAGRQHSSTHPCNLGSFMQGGHLWKPASMPGDRNSMEADMETLALAKLLATRTGSECVCASWASLQDPMGLSSLGPGVDAGQNRRGSTIMSMRGSRVSGSGRRQSSSQPPQAPLVSSMHMSTPGCAVPGALHSAGWGDGQLASVSVDKGATHTRSSGSLARSASSPLSLVQRLPASTTVGSQEPECLARNFRQAGPPPCSPRVPVLEEALPRASHLLSMYRSMTFRTKPTHVTTPKGAAPPPPSPFHATAQGASSPKPRTSVSGSCPCTLPPAMCGNLSDDHGATDIMMTALCAPGSPSSAPGAMPVQMAAVSASLPPRPPPVRMAGKGALFQTSSEHHTTGSAYNTGSAPSFSAPGSPLTATSPRWPPSGPAGPGLARSSFTSQSDQGSSGWKRLSQAVSRTIASLMASAPLGIQSSGNGVVQGAGRVGNERAVCRGAHLAATMASGK